MDQLKGKLVNVVLAIQEGKGMENVKNLALLSANFNGRILESDPVQGEECPSYNSNLIWEIEKRDLRKIRSSNQPLKIECLSVDAQNRRERFGHVLLDLRSAQIVVDQSQQIPFKWHKLLAVRNKKRNCIPELYLSLTIRNQLEEHNEGVVEEIWEPIAREAGAIPIKYLEDGYIMVGDEDQCTEDYSLNILIKSASSLDLLLPEVLVFNQNIHKYTMCIKILGIPIKTKQFSKDLHSKIIFEEKIVVRLLTNDETLAQFFKEETFEIGFSCGSDLLGITTVNFDGLTNLNDKLLLEACLFRFPSPNGVVPTGLDGRNPSLSLDITLVKNKHNSRKCEKSSPTEAVIHDVSKASGDYTETPKDQLILVTKHQVNDFEEWKDRQKTAFEAEFQAFREEALRNESEEIEHKKMELDENIKKCKELQEELQDKLNDLKMSKTLKKKRNLSGSLISIVEENQKKFGDCDKELLIEYVSSLQQDNANLKQLMTEQSQEFEAIQKAALTKEQTTNLLQELKGLEEKFEVAQQTKTYFKEQWKKACQEIHNLKAEDYKLIKDQLREHREELSHLDKLCISGGSEQLLLF